MEILLQYLDDIDDIIGALGLLFEPVRTAFLSFVTVLFAAASVASGVLLALLDGRVALLACALLLVLLLYRTISAEPRNEAPVT